MTISFNFTNSSPSTWLITGVAGFIGSRLLETLLQLNQKVIGLDNFSTGTYANLTDVMNQVSHEQWLNFKLIEGDIRSLDDCQRAVADVTYVLHHAALSSVTKSIAEPIANHTNNVNGFLNILLASRDAHVKRVIYATSSAIYGNKLDIKIETNQKPTLQSPYAASKLMNEIYAEVFFNAYGLESIGLRYFNVYGPRQSLSGDYSAVIPRWIEAMLKHQPVTIYGDGSTTRDFCFIDDIVQANLLAATTENQLAINQVYDVASGQSISLNNLFQHIKKSLSYHDTAVMAINPVYCDFRAGDIRHSEADLCPIQQDLNYKTQYNLEEGLSLMSDWFTNIYFYQSTDQYKLDSHVDL